MKNCMKDLANTIEISQGNFYLIQVLTLISGVSLVEKTKNITYFRYSSFILSLFLIATKLSNSPWYQNLL
jgi:hypothetical protein